MDVLCYTVYYTRHCEGTCTQTDFEHAHLHNNSISSLSRVGNPPVRHDAISIQGRGLSSSSVCYKCRVSLTPKSRKEAQTYGSDGCPQRVILGYVQHC